MNPIKSLFFSTLFVCASLGVWLILEHIDRKHDVAALSLLLENEQKPPAPTAADPPAVTNWDYRIVRGESEFLGGMTYYYTNDVPELQPFAFVESNGRTIMPQETLLCAVGRSGWELVSSHADDAGHVDFIFKRPLK